MAEWKPRVRRINTADVGEQGKLAFISSLIREERLDEAEDELKGLLAANPRSHLANIHMGRLQQRKREFNRAVQHFETARVANPASAQASLLAGAAYLRLDNIERAANAFRAALKTDSKLAPAYVGLGQVHFRRNELVEAKANLQQALALDPQLQQARALLARVHGKQGDLDASIEEIAEVVSARPDQLKAVGALARIHLQRDEPREAIAVLEPALALHENSAELWAMLGRARDLIGDHAGAEQALRKAVEIEPRERLVQQQLLRVLLPQGKTDEALALLDQLPERARRSPRVQAAYGEAHLAAGHHKQAAQFFRAALLRRADGENTVAGLDGELKADNDSDWKALAERYQTALQEARAEASEAADKEEGPAERRRATRRRQARLTAASAA